jgi:hypothetical protein
MLSNIASKVVSYVSKIAEKGKIRTKPVTCFTNSIFFILGLAGRSTFESFLTSP